MKRTIMISTAVALMLALTVVVVASAQGTPAATLATPGACQNGNWVDANGDGVCDNAARDGAGQGMGNGQGMGTGHGEPVRAPTSSTRTKMVFVTTS